MTEDCEVHGLSPCNCDASEVAFTPFGTIVATNVQDAIEEAFVESGVQSFNGRTGVVSPAQADYDGFFLTPAEGNAAYAPITEPVAAAHNADLAAHPAVSTNNQTDNYQLVLTDAGKVIEMDKATAVNLTVPANATVAFPVGTIIEIWQQGAGQVTVVAAGGVTIRTPETLKLRRQYATAVLRKRGTDEWALEGNLELV